jgi:uncharacterized protein (TIGR03435 family)
VRRLAVIVVVIVGAVGAIAQTSRPAFEVVTIKRNTSHLSNNGGGYVSYGRFNMTNVAVRTLIRIAYHTDAELMPSQVVGGPDWTGTARYDITAKTGPEFAGRPAGGQMLGVRRLLLQSLLEERFALRVHRETRDLERYALVRARQDGTLGPSIGPPRRCVPDVPPQCGVTAIPGHFTAGRAPLAALVNYIASGVLVDRVIVDRTGLNGIYELNLDWARDQTETDKPSIFTALQEQLGLKLEIESGPVDVVVVDQVERPVEN